jgi:hypothetical protein
MTLRNKACGTRGHHWAVLLAPPFPPSECEKIRCHRKGGGLPVHFRNFHLDRIALIRRTAQLSVQSGARTDSCDAVGTGAMDNAKMSGCSA